MCEPLHCVSSEIHVNISMTRILAFSFVSLIESESAHMVSMKVKVKLGRENLGSEEQRDAEMERLAYEEYETGKHEELAISLERTVKEMTMLHATSWPPCPTTPKWTLPEAVNLFSEMQGPRGQKRLH